jgi:Bacterial extracellular solute-binding protein/von Willebrand factor type A domain
MGRHTRSRSGRLRRHRWLLAVVLVTAVGVAVGFVVARPTDPTARPAAAPSPSPCTTPLHVVTAASFAPVLSSLAPAMATAEDCVRLEVTVADGRAAADRVASLSAHVWIPDDTAWVATAGSLEIAEPDVGGSGTVVATSPVFMVTDPATAETVEAAGGSWLGLAGLVTNGSGVRLAVRDPAGSGDGLVAAAAVGEAVWLDEGMDASAEALATALPATRTVSGAAAALPDAAGEVGLVPEYALLPVLGTDQGGAGQSLAVLTGSDHTAALRFTWLPTAVAARDPVLLRAMDTVLESLAGPPGQEALAAAGLRGPGGDPPDEVSVDDLPTVSAAPFEVLGAHHVDHVFATWYAADRRSDVLVVVDVSGSMREVAPGSDEALIDVVREGVDRLAELLPDESELALWEFGSLLDPPRDHRVLLPRAALTGEHRQALGAATGALTATDTGTGLHDTLLAAYTSARDGYRPGTPNHLVLFTDGTNEDDPGSLSAEDLAGALADAQDPRRPVLLTVITFGPEPDTAALEAALEPVEGHVQALTTADEVRAVFIHQAAGGLHH